MLGIDELDSLAVAETDQEVEFMREAYKGWLEAMAQSEKFKNVQPDWTFIDDPEEAEKVGGIWPWSPAVFA